MRHLFLGACAAALMTAVTGGAAEARDYPYCLTSPGYGYPGDCAYASYGQCRARASGLLADCIVNPRVAYGAQQEPRRRGRAYRGEGRW